MMDQKTWNPIKAMGIGEVTWKCHICGEVRPNDKISVLSKPLVINGEPCGQQNIRYCNDRRTCIEGAKTFSFMKPIILYVNRITRGTSACPQATTIITDAEIKTGGHGKVLQVGKFIEYADGQWEIVGWGFDGNFPVEHADIEALKQDCMKLAKEAGTYVYMLNKTLTVLDKSG